MSRQRPHAAGCTCFGCKVDGLAYGALKSKHGADPVQRIPVIAERGPRRGRPVGEHAVHWDGRQDATMRPAPVRITTKVD